MDAFFPEGSFYAAVAFTSDSRRGNPTGIVFAHPEWTDASCQRIAAELGFPDTAFLRPRVHGWTVRFFSPSQPLSLCVQALIACGAVVGRRGEVSLLTEAGEVQVAAEGGRYRAIFPRERVRDAAGAVSSEVATLALPGSGPGRVIDSGRVRLFREVADKAALDGISIPAADVMAICRSTGLQGLCFWTRLGADALGLRVFTPSLDGGEDASTGGAVLGMASFLPPGTWRVEQGAGGYHRTGELWLRSGETFDIGGAVKVVGSGTLTDL